MAPALDLERRVRPRQENSEDEDEDEDFSTAVESVASSSEDGVEEDGSDDSSALSIADNVRLSPPAWLMLPRNGLTLNRQRLCNLHLQTSHSARSQQLKRALESGNGTPLHRRVATDENLFATD